MTEGKVQLRTGYFPLFLILLGAVNILFAVCIAQIRLAGVEALIQAADSNRILGILEPYGKVLVETALTLFFVRLIHKQHCQLSRNLMLAWSFIVIIIQIVYYISKAYYTGMLKMMQGLLTPRDYLFFYVSTHTYKYVPMFIAIIMGAMITGILLQDKGIILSTILACIIYAACYGASHEAMIHLWDGRVVSVVFSALVYHMTQSVGILLLGIYIRRKYRASYD